MTIALLFQQTGAAGFLTGILPFLLVIVVFYFLIIVPQRRRQKELQETVQSLKAGDRIVTTGGIIGKVTEVRDSSLLIRSADKSILEVARTAVAGLDKEEESK
jgi:preprotein translocase subunit YajC